MPIIKFNGLWKPSTIPFTYLCKNHLIYNKKNTPSESTTALCTSHNGKSNNGTQEVKNTVQQTPCLTAEIMWRFVVYLLCIKLTIVQEVIVFINLRNRPL